MGKYIILLFSLLFALTGCGESIYSSAENTNTKEASIDDFDFSFMSGECSEISAYYQAQIDAGVTLDEDGLYKYISSLLACSGFNLVKGAESIVQTGGNDIYETASAILGHNVIDINTSLMLQTQYTKAIQICDNYTAEFAKDNLTLNNTNLTLCGLAGTMGTVVNISSMLLNATGGGANSFELSETGLQDFGNIVNPTIIAQSLSSYLKQYNLFLSTLDSGLKISENGAKVIGDLLGQDSFSKVINDLSKDLRDSQTNSITEDSLIQYIAKTLNIEIPENIFPSIPSTPEVPGDIEIPGDVEIPDGVVVP